METMGCTTKIPNQVEMWPLVRRAVGGLPARPFKDNIRRATAYHEAGHAVVAWSLGIKVKAISIFPGRPRGQRWRTLGRVRTESQKKLTEKGLHHSLLISMGGIQGELMAHVLGLVDPKDITIAACAFDIEKAKFIFGRVQTDEDNNASADLVLLKMLREAFVILVGHYAALVRLSETLLHIKKMSGRHATQVIEEALAELHNAPGWIAEKADIAMWAELSEAVLGDPILERTVRFPITTQMAARFV